MSDLIALWWLLPAAVLIAAVAMTFGIGGAIFFSPFLAQIAIWAVPGVVLGAQLGVRVSKRIDRRKALLMLPVLFAAVAVLTVANALL